MGPLFEIFAAYWWLAFPFAGLIAGGFRARAAQKEREHQRQIELYKLQHPEAVGLEAGAPVTAAAPATAAAFSEADVETVMATHDTVNRRWLDYELDVRKLIDFPMMTDVREPLTVAFLRAKRDADALRPVSAADVGAKSRWDDYRNAVNAFGTAFDVAEKEAHRIKDSAFSEPERHRLSTAKKLINIADDDAASPAERQSAYKRARRELDGIMVLPDVTVAALEQKIARMIGTAE